MNFRKIIFMWLGIFWVFDGLVSEQNLDCNDAHESVLFEKDDQIKSLFKRIAGLLQQARSKRKSSLFTRTVQKFIEHLAQILDQGGTFEENQEEVIKCLSALRNIGQEMCVADDSSGLSI